MPFSTMQDYPLTMRPILEHGRTRPRRQQGHHLHRRRVRRGDVRRGGRSCRPIGRGADPVGRRAGRPRRHVHVEQPDAPRGLPGRAVHGCGAAHAEHPPVPRAAGVRHQPRRGPGDHRRRLDHPAAGQGSRPADDGRAHHRQGLGRHLGARRRRSTTTRCSPPSNPASTTPTSTNAPAWPCATRAAPRATPRA